MEFKARAPTSCVSGFEQGWVLQKDSDGNEETFQHSINTLLAILDPDVYV